MTLRFTGQEYFYVRKVDVDVDDEKLPIFSVLIGICFENGLGSRSWTSVFYLQKWDSVSVNPSTILSSFEENVFEDPFGINNQYWLRFIRIGTFSPFHSDFIKVIISLSISGSYLIQRRNRLFFLYFLDTR